MDETAVSNAVLWWITTEDGENANPTLELATASVDLWAKMLGILQPRRIVAAGAWARDVVTKAISAAKVGVTPTTWALPSRRLLGPLSQMVNRADLFDSFPEVREVMARHPDWVGGSYANNKVLYACLAVSVAAVQHGVAPDDRPRTAARG